jgi:hypothetical protein
MSIENNINNKNIAADQIKGQYKNSAKKPKQQPKKALSQQLNSNFAKLNQMRSSSPSAQRGAYNPADVPAGKSGNAGSSVPAQSNQSTPNRTSPPAQRGALGLQNNNSTNSSNSPGKSSDPTGIYAEMDSVANYFGIEGKARGVFQINVDRNGFEREGMKYTDYNDSNSVSDKDWSDFKKSLKLSKEHEATVDKLFKYRKGMGFDTDFSTLNKLDEDILKEKGVNVGSFKKQWKSWSAARLKNAKPANNNNPTQSSSAPGRNIKTDTSPTISKLKDRLKLTADEGKAIDAMLQYRQDKGKSKYSNELSFEDHLVLKAHGMSNFKKQEFFFQLKGMTENAGSIKAKELNSNSAGSKALLAYRKMNKLDLNKTNLTKDEVRLMALAEENKRKFNVDYSKIMVSDVRSRENWDFYHFGWSIKDSLTPTDSVG